MGNPMIQVEHCPEIDDAKMFEIEFKEDWGKAATLGLVPEGCAIFHQGNVIIPVKGDKEV